jgi:serine/threonine-protein kinase
VREVGRVGKYELITRLATGGMAEIFLARLRGEAGFEKLVVLKLILPELAEDPEFVRMFLDEARLSARISHPNVCPVFDLGQADGRYFVAMEYLEGVPLMSVMRELSRARRLEPRLIAGLMVQACEGLHHAHELRDVEGQPIGVVHRDVSPSNLFVTVDGVVKVLDFGVAKALAAAQRSASGSLKGHYAYMAPEQVQAQPLDRRADVFALGVLLFELATGKRLFRRESDLATFRAITEEPIPRVREVEPHVPAALADAVDRALQRDPARRFPTARALGEALAAAVAPLGGALSGAALSIEVSGLVADDLAKRRATIAGALALTGHDPQASEAPTSAASPHSRPRPRALPWLAIGALALALAGAGFYAARPSPSPLPARGWPTAGHAAPAVGGPAAQDVTTASAVPTRPDPTAASARPEPLPARPTRSSQGQGAGTPGFLTMDSQPFATVFVDGRSLGPTPLYRVPLAPGAHKIVALSSKGEKRSFTVHIEPGREAPPRRLVW